MDKRLFTIRSLQGDNMSKLCLQVVLLPPSDQTNQLLQSLSYKVGCYLGLPDLSFSAPGSHSFRTRVSEQLLVSCNCHCLTLLFFTLRPQRQSTHPSTMLRVHMGDTRRSHKRPESLLFITIRHYKDGKSSCCLAKTAFSVSEKVILMSFSKISLQALCWNRTSYHLEGFQGHNRQDWDSRYMWWNKKTPACFLSRMAAHFPLLLR